MVRWPTSLLPITLSGRPTAPPDASSRACGPRSSSSIRGWRAAAMALPGPVGPMPYPSRMQRTTGRNLKPRSRPRPRAFDGVTDPRELVRHERGAADERAVDARLIGELGDRVAGDAAAVQHAHGVRRGRAEQRGDLVADRLDRGARVRAVRRHAGADRPDRLVRDRDPPRLPERDIRERGAHLRADEFVGSSRVPHLERIADTEDRMQRGIERATELGVHPRVGIAALSAHLAVPDDHVAHEAAEHRRRDAARVRAALALVHVLRGEAQLARADRIAYRRERDVRRRDRDLDGAGPRRRERDFPSERDRLDDRCGVHLPVAGDERPAVPHATYPRGTMRPSTKLTMLTTSAPRMACTKSCTTSPTAAMSRPATRSPASPRPSGIGWNSIPGSA